MAAPEASGAENKMATSEKFAGSKTRARISNTKATFNSPRVVRHAEESPEEAKHLNKRTVMTPDASSNAKRPPTSLSPFQLFGNAVKNASNYFLSKVDEEEEEEDLKKGDENEAFEDAQEGNMSENQLDTALDDEVMLTQLLSRMSPERITKAIMQVQETRGLQFLELKAGKIDATTQVETNKSEGLKKKKHKKNFNVPVRPEAEVDSKTTSTAPDDSPEMENKGIIVKIHEKSGGYFFGFIKSKAQNFFFSGYNGLFKQYDEVNFDITSQKIIKGKLPTVSNIKVLSKRKICTGSVINIVVRKTHLFGFLKIKDEEMYFTAAAKSLIKVGDVLECVLGPAPLSNTKKQTCFLLPKSANPNTNSSDPVAATASEITTDSIPMSTPQETMGQQDAHKSTFVSKPIASSQ